MIDELVLEDPAEAVEKMRAQRAENVKVLATRRAAGEKVDPAELDAALMACGTSPVDFRAMVQRHLDRAYYRETMNARAEHESNLDAV